VASRKLAYPRAVIRHWMAAVTGGVIGFLLVVGGTVLPLVAATNRKLNWAFVWGLASGAAIIVGLMTAQYLAWRDERQAVTEMETRLDTIRYRFQMIGLSGGPLVGIPEGASGPETGYRFALTFKNGGLEVLEYEIEALSMSIGGQTAVERARFDSTTGVILPGDIHTFWYHWIPAPIDAGKPLPLGGGEYTAVYGHPSGGSRFRTHHEFNIAWLPGESPIPNWITRGEITHEPA